MKLIIQIPAYNEEQTLAIALRALPKKIEGIDVIEYLLIDDGSKDKTSEVAKQEGVHHVIKHATNKGLAKAFLTGIKACLIEGADIIVNTDADNQYHADDIEKLVRPILNNEAEIVIGERPIFKTAHFSLIKKLLQKLGSYVVRKASQTDIMDAPSGFRAISREAALKLNVFNPFSYTIETIIQAGRLKIPMKSVPIRTNEDLRPSKLVKSISHYIRQMMFNIMRVLNTYKPLKVFLTLSVIPLVLGIGLGIRWIILFMGKGSGLHIPSLILASILVLLGSQLAIFGLIADLISVNRQLLEDTQFMLREKLYTKSTSTPVKDDNLS